MSRRIPCSFEFINYLYTSFFHAQAQDTGELMFQQAASGCLKLVHVSADQFHRAWQLRKKYHDKPDISFIDFTSFVVMPRTSGLATSYGYAHFERVCLSFRLAP